jgi:hypothetical protein
MLRAILLVVVVVLVLDLLWGVNCNANRSARVTRASRFGRGLALPSDFASFALFGSKRSFR